MLDKIFVSLSEHGL